MSATIRPIMRDSRYFFLCIPSMRLLKVGTLAAGTRQFVSPSQCVLVRQTDRQTDTRQGAPDKPDKLPEAPVRIPLCELNEDRVSNASLW